MRRGAWLTRRAPEQPREKQSVTQSVHAAAVNKKPSDVANQVTLHSFNRSCTACLEMPHTQAIGTHSPRPFAGGGQRETSPYSISCAMWPRCQAARGRVVPLPTITFTRQCPRPPPPPQEAKPPRPPAPRSPRRPSQAGLQAATHLLSVCIGVPASTAARAISHPSFTLSALPHTYSPAPALSTTVSVTCARSGRGQGVVTAWSGRGQGVWVG